MNHVLEQLNEYLDGTLDPDEEQLVEEHIQGCDRCHEELESIRSLRQKTTQLPRLIHPQRDLWQDVARRIQHLPSGAEALRWKSWRARLKPRQVRFAFAIAVVVAAIAVGVYWMLGTSPPAWNVEVTQGNATIDSRELPPEHAAIKIGETLQTDSEGRARVEVADIGYVDVDPNTTLRLVQATPTDHRFALDRGTIRAVISAPPRLFFVQTPSALAVDLGCTYTLDVDSKGGGILQVTSGWVMLEFGGRMAVVPAGAECVTMPGFGPGTPYQVDASQRLLTSLALYDFGGGGTAALDTVLQQARNMDSITLWHLFFKTTGDERARVYDRLASLVPPPEGVDRAGMLAGNPEMIKKWQEQLNLGFQEWWKFNQ